MPIRLMENFRAVFYAPYYATHALGFYQREGVEVELLTSDAPGDAVPKLIDGTIDLTWGGPMRVMRAHDQDRHSPLVNFCEVVSHDPFFLIGKRGAGALKLAELAGKRFATVSEVPTPWMCLQQDLRDQGMDPEKLARFVSSQRGSQFLPDGTLKFIMKATAAPEVLDNLQRLMEELTGPVSLPSAV